MATQIQVAESNPDPDFNGCRVLNLEERGVLFLNVEPQVGSMMFVGKTAIYESFAKVNDLTIRNLNQMIAGGTTKQKERIDELEQEVRQLKKAVKDAYKRVAEFGEELTLQYQFIEDKASDD